MNQYSQELTFNPASNWTKQQFGERIQKIPVDGGFSCPNRDGKLSKLGCLYCNNNAFTPFYTDSTKTINQQLQTGTEFFSKRYNCNSFFAYFQTYSGTYAPIDILEKKYNEAIEAHNIKGLIISTRPDCINSEVIDLLIKLKKKTYIRVEIGVESFDNKTLEAINRCHSSETAINALNQLNQANIDTSAHLIFGLPQEPANCAKIYSEILSNTKTKFVKLHHLQIVTNSQLESIYNSTPNTIKLHTLESYISTVSDFLSNLRPDVYIERFINRVPQKMLIAPKFGNINENKFTQLLCDYMKQNNLYQGIFCTL